MASAFSKQMPVLLILLLFFLETAAIKCYQQPGIDPNSNPKINEEEAQRLTEENKDKMITIDCDDYVEYCVEATGCKSKPPMPILKGVFLLRGCGFANNETCNELSSVCVNCVLCKDNLCNGGSGGDGWISGNDNKGGGNSGHGKGGEGNEGGGNGDGPKPNGVGGNGGVIHSADNGGKGMCPSAMFSSIMLMLANIFVVVLFG